MQFNRRQILKLISAGGVSLYLAPYAERAYAAASPMDTWLTAVSPIDRTLPDVARAVFYADDPERAHGILWDKKSFIAKGGAQPPPAERAKVVIIGGGMAGLLTAFQLRKYKPIVLEQAPRFGGNCKGQSWRGIDYALGAAYICEPEEGGDIHSLLSELKVLEKGKIKEEEDPVAIGGKVFKEFWGGATAAGDDAAQQQFATLREYFEKVNAAEEMAYPDIPLPEDDEEVRNFVLELDGISFKAHLESLVGTTLHPHIETAIEHYCWSSFGASATEISAACGLNFYAAEFSNLIVFPGGNAGILERVVGRLASELPRESLRTDALVYDVKAASDGVVVSYQDGSKRNVAIKADYVVMACPKFVAAKLIDDLETERLEAIRKLRYHGYLVGNVLLNGKAPESFYDLYLMGEGKVDTSDVMAATKKQKVTDVILANYVQASDKGTVLTLYRGMPYTGSRAELYLPDAYKTARAEFEEQIHREILPLLKLRKEDVVDLRIARWGHPLPVAAPGLIKDGTTELLRKPFKERVFFVEQDNWALPAFETSATESITWSRALAAKLG